MGTGNFTDEFKCYADAQILQAESCLLLACGKRGGFGGEGANGPFRRRQRRLADRSRPLS